MVEPTSQVIPDGIIFVEDHKFPWTDGTLGTYTGQMLNSKLHGKGIYRWENNGILSSHIYDGYWSDNKMNGRGTYKWTNNQFYVGDWKDGKMNGRGTLSYWDGSVYDGEWKDDAKNG